MKNIQIESLKRQAKQYHRSRRGDQFENGILIFHTYEGLPADRLTWWDDVTFILNDYRVALAWTHPRMEFQDALDDEADLLAPPQPDCILMREGTPVFKRIGASRKRHTHTVYPPLSAACSEDLKQWKKIRQEVAQSTALQIEPYLNRRWCRYSRLVNLCAPIEVRNEGDLRTLVALTIRLLKCETTLSELFPNYRYSGSDWKHDGWNLVSDDLHIHKLAQ